VYCGWPSVCGETSYDRTKVALRPGHFALSDSRKNVEKPTKNAPPGYILSLHHHEPEAYLRQAVQAGSEHRANSSRGDYLFQTLASGLILMDANL